MQGIGACCPLPRTVDPEQVRLVEIIGLRTGPTEDATEPFEDIDTIEKSDHVGSQSHRGSRAPYREN